MVKPSSNQQAPKFKIRLPRLGGSCDQFTEVLTSYCKLKIGDTIARQSNKHNDKSIVWEATTSALLHRMWDILHSAKATEMGKHFQHLNEISAPSDQVCFSDFYTLDYPKLFEVIGDEADRLEVENDNPSTAWYYDVIRFMASTLIHKPEWQWIR